MVSNDHLVSILKITKRTTHRWRQPGNNEHVSPLPFQRSQRSGRIFYDPKSLAHWIEINKPNYLNQLEEYLKFR